MSIFECVILVVSVAGEVERRAAADRKDRAGAGGEREQQSLDVCLVSRLFSSSTFIGDAADVDVDVDDDDDFQTLFLRCFCFPTVSIWSSGKDETVSNSIETN